jgi:adenylate cyclase
MKEGTRKLWYGLREHATHWVIGGTLLALTGFAPEEWLAHTVHGLHIPDSVLHLWAAGVDVRAVPIAIGMAVIAIGLLRQRQAFQLAPASGPSVPRAGPAGAPPIDAAGTAKTVEQLLVQGYPDALPLPDKPSIAVLPFTNMSGDPEHEYFSDGLTEDIITELSHSRTLFVIARNSSFSYKGRAVDVRQVARELGVRYVLEGSVRRSAERVRVTAQLIDAESGSHVWAERLDRDLADVFVLQDEITNAVIEAVEPAVREAERERSSRRPPESLRAWESYHRGLWHLASFGVANNEKARSFFQRAIELDPKFAAAHAGLAQTIVAEGVLYLTRDLRESLDAALVVAQRAVALDPADANAHSALAELLGRLGDHDAGLAEARRALAISPNLADAYVRLAASLTYSGRYQEGLEAVNRGIRLDPRNPRLYVTTQLIAIVHYFLRDYASAVETAEQATRLYPDFPSIHIWLAAALAQAGRQPEGRDVLRKAAAMAPRLFDVYVRARPPWFRPEDHEHMLDGLRKAGWQAGLTRR